MFVAYETKQISQLSDARITKSNWMKERKINCECAQIVKHLEANCSSAHSCFAKKLPLFLCSFSRTPSMYSVRDKFLMQFVSHVLVSFKNSFVSTRPFYFPSFFFLFSFVFLFSVGFQTWMPSHVISICCHIHNW